MITVYTTPTCAYCKTTKDYLTAKKAAYKVVDVGLRPDPTYMRLALQYGSSVPLVTDGTTAYTGWNLAKLNNMIKAQT